MQTDYFYLLTRVLHLKLRSWWIWSRESPTLTKLSVTVYNWVAGERGLPMLTSFYSYNWKYPETSRTHSPPQSIHILLNAPSSITLSRHECSMVLPACTNGNALSAIRATSSRKHILDMIVYPFIKEEGLLIEGSQWNWRWEGRSLLLTADG